jgi:hypothetical protein
MSEPQNIRALPAASQSPTSAVDLLVISFGALNSAEQEETLTRLQEAYLQREAGELSETERFLASLQRVTEIIGRSITVADYRAEIQREMREGGPGLEPLSQIIRHFGSWRMAKEALELSESNTARRIEARFANRRVGRVHRYTEQTLSESLQRCVIELGHLPQLGEYKLWRERELEVARAQGNRAFHLPGAGPFRRRYGAWEDTLLHFGYPADAVAARLERS